MKGAARKGIPLLIGSCATSGRDWGVDWFAGMARDTAKTIGRKLKVAKIYSELSADYVAEKLRAGKLHALDPAPQYDEDVIRRSVRIVGVMGAEQFQAALDLGADVVLGGRATDTGIFAAIPLARGSTRAWRGTPARSPSADRRRPSPAAASTCCTSRWSATRSLCSHSPTTFAVRRSASRRCNSMR